MAASSKCSWLRTVTAIGMVLLHSLPYASCLSDYGSEEVRLVASITSNLTHYGNSSPPAVHQNMEFAPAFPIIEVSTSLILAAINDTSVQSPPSGATSALTAANQSTSGLFGRNTNPATLNSLVKRDAEPCAVGQPCPDDSCCSTSGKCGYGPDYCGAGNCTSNCDSTAMCGMYSEGGSLKCGMNLCCSHFGWCGTDELHCGDPDPNGLTPCQAGFGLCTIIPPPACDPGANSAGGRSVGYYQASNTNDRLCQRISPSQIDITGLTHLYFAFAEIDPTTFAIVVANDGDEDRYMEFNKLQSGSLKTWIAIGGFDFSDPGATRTTWSDLSSTQENRAAFISGLMAFMAKYGFQGVDLDWEYPGTPERGGDAADTQNYVSLVKEMRAAFGDKYGLSLTLAPDYWYLRGFDAKAMEPYVDFFGFMAYDLHGFWDADIKTLGSIVRGQTDVREIFNDTLPLWFDALDPAKINFGLAYYGRGYTLANPSCNQLGCLFIGPSLPGPCTNFNGVLSLAEIQGYIKNRGLTPQLLQGPMMKQITWDDQWIGYDDIDTVAMKKQWASGLCFGGTMVWSVDFNSGNGSGADDPDNNAPVTPDGSCGPTNGGTVCGDFSGGGCCSSSGFCGKGPDFCGNGCQSGPCLAGAETTDGTCGPTFGDSICGSWSGGACCSSSGFCGSEDTFCGVGCISGPCDDSTSDTGSSGDVYIDPSIWSMDDPEIYCIPPCIYILPPLTLSSTTTIVFPLFTTSLEVAWPTAQLTTLEDGNVSTSTGYDRITETTTLTIPPITTDRIELWNINVTSGMSSSSLVYITSSIRPPPFTITDDTNPFSQSGVTHPPQTRTITPPPFPYSTISPDPRQYPPVTHINGPPKKPCKIGCGHKCFGFFCNTPCLLDCVPAPPGFNDPGDPDPEGPPTPNPGPGPGPGPGPEPEPKSCSESTVTDFWVSCTSISADSSSCTTTSSSLVIGCDITASATTTGSDSCATDNADEDQGEDGTDPDFPVSGSSASALSQPTAAPTQVSVTNNPAASTTQVSVTIAPAAASTTQAPPFTTPPFPPTPTPSCYLQNEDPGLGVYSAYCVCDGSLNYAEPSSTGSCAFTALPPQTINPTSSQNVVNSNCQVCTVVDENNGVCTTVPSCTPTPTSTAPPPPTPPSSTPPILPPPPPPAPTQIFNIGYTTSCEPDGGELAGSGSSCASNWAVFTDPMGTTYNACNDKAIYEDLKPFKPNSPSYPISKGPFAGGGLENCMFTKKDKGDVGAMSCGDTKGECTVDGSARVGCPDTSVWVGVGVCSFG